MKWKYSLLLLFGIGISNIGAWVYLIALNLIVLNLTGSALAVSTLYILVPGAALCTHFWSGSFIDRANKKRLMISIDIIRAMFIFILPFLDNLLLIYVLVFMINIAGAIFEPASMVYMTKLIDEKYRQRFNALRNFINSSGFILGPSIAGFLFMIGTPDMAIFMNAGALCISAVVLLMLPDLELKKDDIHLEKITLSTLLRDWRSILRFSKTKVHITFMYVLISGATVFMTALDSMEAAFATEVLFLSESKYGFLVSIAGVGIILGSFVNAVCSYKLKVKHLIIFGALVTPTGYIVFSLANNFIFAAVGFFTLTFALSFLNTGFLTFYQSNIPAGIMGRFSSVFGTLEALATIIFTSVIGISAEIFELRLVYIMAAFFFLVLGVLIMLAVTNKYHYSYYEVI